MVGELMARRRAPKTVRGGGWEERKKRLCVCDSQKGLGGGAKTRVGSGSFGEVFEKGQRCKKQTVAAERGGGNSKKKKTRLTRDRAWEGVQKRLRVDKLRQGKKKKKTRVRGASEKKLPQARGEEAFGSFATCANREKKKQI